jgi:hypothetical protein
MAKSSAVWDSALSSFRPLILAQGEVAYAYNLLHEKFFEIFNLVMALDRSTSKPTTFYPYAQSVWHVMQNDRQQRQLAMTTLTKLPTDLDIKGGIERLLWAQKHADKLADYRNLIVHAPMQFKYPYPLKLKGNKLPEPVPGLGGASTRPANSRKFRRLKDLKFWKSLRNDFLNLSDYVDFVGRQIAWRDYERLNGPVPGANHSWPHKPQLRCIRRMQLIEQQIQNETMQPPKRRRRRKPSRG